jgi:uncharacterized protein YaaN involved in tellurite resistance
MGVDEVRKEIGEVQLSSNFPRELVEEVKGKLDLKRPESILYYGVDLQERLDQISSQMLEGVRDRDLGEIGGKLKELVLNLKGLKLEEVESRPAWWERLLGLKRSVEELFEEYREVEEQVEGIVTKLERDRLQLERDLIQLEELYNRSLQYLQQLELYIKAGEEKLEELNRLIEERRREVEEKGGVIEAQQLRDLIEFRDNLDRRLHDLKLTRQVVLQSLANIRLIQENNKVLINKITSTILNTIPLWKSRMAQVVAIARGQGVASDLKGASDFTNQLLEEGARQLKESTEAIRREGERGIVDIESLKRANQQLIEALLLSAEIAEEGRQKRREGEKVLRELEEQLKEGLIEVRQRRLGLKGGAKGEKGGR